MITKILKRDGREVPFNIEKITNAIYKATIAAGEEDYEKAMAWQRKLWRSCIKTQIFRFRLLRIYRTSSKEF